jgi:hypothetical protein
MMAKLSSIRNQDAIIRISIARMRNPKPNWIIQVRMGTGNIGGTAGTGNGDNIGNYS